MNDFNTLSGHRATYVILDEIIESGELDRFNEAVDADGSDGLGDPTTSKGLQLVVYTDNTYDVVPYSRALSIRAMYPDAIAMIDVAALRGSLRQALN